MSQQQRLKKTGEPSKLSRQIHSWSTDDSRAPTPEGMQVPDSQTVIPETQLDDDANDMHGDDDGSVSPETAALIAKNSVAKSKTAVEPIPFQLNLFSKDALIGRPREPSPTTFNPFRPAGPVVSNPKKTPQVNGPNGKSSSQPVNMRPGSQSGLRHTAKGQCLPLTPP